MRKLLALYIIIFCVIPFRVFASESSTDKTLVITQVQVSGPAGSDDEFIELQNVSGSDINVRGWSIQYKSSSSGYPVSAKRNLPEVIIPAGKYFLIANSDYSGPVVPDLAHSSFSLSGSSSGAIIFISNGTDYIQAIDDHKIVDYLDYSQGVPESGKSLKRVDYTGVFTTDYVLGNSAPRNLAHIASDGVGHDTAADTDYTASDEDEQLVIYSSSIKISEVLPNPTGTDSGKEWIELYNDSTTAVNLKDWILDDDGPEGSEPGSSAYTLPELTINPRQYLAINLPAGKFSLNNSSTDSVRLFWPDKVLLQAVKYTVPAKENTSWCLLENKLTWCKPTKDVVNAAIIVADDNDDAELENAEEDYSKYSIKIIGALINPIGADAGSEYVILQNLSQGNVKLKDWILDDGVLEDKVGSSAYALEDITLEPNEEVEITIPKGKFSLNNSGEDGIRLFSPDKKLKDITTYEKAKEGVVYGKVAGVWSWIEDFEVEPDDQIKESSNTQSTKKQAKPSKLPRTGLDLRFLFVIFLAICYISCGFSNKKEIYEQTRSH